MKKFEKLTIGLIFLSAIIIVQTNKLVSAESIMLQTTDAIHITNELQQAKVTAFFNNQLEKEELEDDLNTEKETKAFAQSTNEYEKSAKENNIKESNSIVNNNETTTPEYKPEPQPEPIPELEPEPEYVPEPEPTPPTVLYPEAPTSTHAGYFASLNEALEWGAYNFPEGSTNYQAYTAGYLQNGTPYYGVDYYY